MTALSSCLNVMAHIDARFGGLSACVPELCNAVRATGRWESPLAAFCLSDERPVDPNPGLRPIHTFPLGRRNWLPGSVHRAGLGRLIAASGAVHVHGLWQEHSQAACALAVSHRRPLLVSAHGMLDPWAMRQKAWKKRLYSSFIEKPNLARAACLRALTLDEADDYRRFGLVNPIAVIPNGITAPGDLSAEPFWRRFPELRGRRIVLYLGRVHLKKGVDLLVQAWTLLAKRPDAVLAIAGPDPDSLIPGLIERGPGASAPNPIVYLGMLQGPDKWAALAASTVFALPSHSEGFSVAVLEALAASCPVLISPACHFPEVPESGCGWCVSPTVENIQEGLERILDSPPGHLAEAGAKGRRLVEDRFSWHVIGRQTVEVLDWVLGGPRPAQVEFR